MCQAGTGTALRVAVRQSYLNDLRIQLTNSTAFHGAPTPTSGLSTIV